MPKRTVKPGANNSLINALNYKRLIKMGEIPLTKSNKKIPPFNNGHKMHLNKLFKQNPVLSEVCASPAQWAVHLLKDPERVRSAAAPMGLDRYVGKSSLYVKARDSRRSYFNEKKLTLTLANDKTGVKLVVPFADWDALGVAGAILDVRFTPQRIEYDGARKQRVDEREVDEDTGEDGEIKHRSSEIAVFDTNNFDTMAGKYDRDGFISEGFSYKLNTLNLHGVRRGICFVQRNDGAADWGKDQIKQAMALTKRLAHSSDFRKR